LTFLTRIEQWGASLDASSRTTLIDRVLAAHDLPSRQTPEGGYFYYRVPEWGVEEPNAPDTYAALVSLRLLAVPLPACDRTIQRLRSLRLTCGGYPTLTIDRSALCALEMTGSQPLRLPRAGSLVTYRGSRVPSPVVKCLASFARSSNWSS
jgi:hypothetical protein